MSQQYPQQPGPYNPGPQSYGYPGQPAPQPPKKNRKGLKITLGVVGAIILISIIGGAMGGGSDDTAPAKDEKPVAAAPAEQPADDEQAAEKPEKKVAPADKPTKSPEPPAKPKVTEYTEGDYIVGEDIPEGTYTSAGAKKGLFEFCSITSKPSDESRMPILKAANAGERIIVTLTKADGVVTVSNCEPLRKK